MTDDRVRPQCAKEETGSPFDDKKHWVARYQSTANYRFWRTRGQFEMQPTVQEATKALTLSAGSSTFKQELSACAEKVITEKGPGK